MILETLSPLFIGSGDKLKRDLDYFRLDKKLWFFDIEKLFEKNAEYASTYIQQSAQRDFDNHKYLGVLKDVAENSNIIARNYPREIFEFIHSGSDQAFIPGSSIKGAIRSIIIKKLSGTMDLSEINANNEKQYLNDLLVPNKTKMNLAANYNIMRTFQFYDIYFAKKELAVLNANILSLEGTTGENYKLKATKQGKPISISFQALPAGKIIAGNIYRIDNLLFDKDNCFSELKFDYSLIKSLKQIINDYSVKYIEKEIDFFTKCDVINCKLNSLIEFYTKLKSDIEKASEDEIFFRMGKGSGWKFITGHLVDDDKILLKKIRKEIELDKKQKNLGKKGYDIFPKTRILINLPSNQDSNYLPMGWVKIDLKKTGEIYDQQVEHSNYSENNEIRIQPDINNHKIILDEEAIIKKNSKKTLKAGQAIEARVTKNEGNNYFVSLLHKSYLEKELSFTYPVASFLQDAKYVMVSITDTKTLRLKFVKKL